MRVPALDPRLRSAANLVRQDATLADIGTDHALLPLFLLKEGRIRRAYCCDINDGPLAAARENVLALGESERVRLILTDGARGLAGLGITDYTVCGMGGELIARIVAEAEQLRDENINLVLQPMSRQSTLRRELYRLGFSILEERYSRDAGKFYVCMRAAYAGVPCEISEELAELGVNPDIDGGRVEYIGYLEARLRSAERALVGQRRGGGCTKKDEALFNLIKTRLHELKGD